MSDFYVYVRRGETPADLRERLLASDEFRERWISLVVLRLLDHSIRCRSEVMQHLVAEETVRVFAVTADAAATKATELRDDLIAMDCDSEAERLASLLISRVFRLAVDTCVGAVRRAIAARN